MKLRFTHSGLDNGSQRRGERGFTLAEILIAMAIFLLVVAGILSANLFGLRMFQANATKLTATQWSRTTFGKLADEVRACNAMSIGNVTNGSFEGLLDGEAQQGNSLMIYPTADTNSYILYFLNAPDQTFRRLIRQTNTALVPQTNMLKLAFSVTNTTIFSAQDFSGNVLSNLSDAQGAGLIHIKLEFYQPQRYLVAPDYYKLETSVTRRALQ